ncbi:MAG: serine/threonine-protein kinase [Planctomycetota bacterium]
MADNHKSMRLGHKSMQLGPGDETLDVAISSVSGDPFPSDSGTYPQRNQYIQLIEGSGGDLTGETCVLLQSRLRVSAFVLALGFGVFLIWRGLAGLFEVAAFSLDATFLGQLLVFLILVACGLWCCRACPGGSGPLRFLELLIFGLPAIFLFGLYFNMMRECATEDQMLIRPDAPWLVLMYLYAMFIPNTWRRAAVVIGAMALSPIAITAVLWSTDQICAQLISAELWRIISMLLILLISGVASVLGVHTINTLRVEAFQAKQLGQYRLGQRLGAGGMGEVYLAEHQLMKRPVAIKLIRPEQAGDPRIFARFEREVRATAQLSHWNNIDIFDYGRTADGTFYYVMEYLPGLSLADLVTRHGPLPPGRAIYLLRQTCEALSEAHARGLIHRDIKPANIFAAERGHKYDVAKLLDFGMVKPLGGVDSSHLTHDGSITGSPLFMSPEQATGDSEPDERSDIYSMGVVAYYLLTGKTPFDGNQPIKILVAHAQRKPKQPSLIRPGLPQDLEAVVLRCLAKSPADRYDSAMQLAEALDACVDADQWSAAIAADWWQGLETKKLETEMNCNTA